MKKVLLLGLSLFMAPSLADIPNKPSQNNPYPVIQFVLGLMISLPSAIVYAHYLDAKEQWPNAPSFHQWTEHFLDSIYSNGSDS
jgi:hypothetical protein